MGATWTTQHEQQHSLPLQSPSQSVMNPSACIQQSPAQRNCQPVWHDMSEAGPMSACAHLRLSQNGLALQLISTDVVLVTKRLHPQCLSAASGEGM